MPASLFRTAGLYLHTLRHLQPSQAVARLSLLTKQHLWPAARYARPRFGRMPDLTPVRNSVRESYSRSSYVPPDGFDFLNRALNTGGDWFPPGAPALWIYNLHYFDYLFEVADAADYRRLIGSWIEAVPPKTRHAWHPYTTSLRVCNWIWTLPHLVDELDEAFLIRMLDSLRNQLEFVADHLEFDVLGNHLLENLKALVVGGTFFRDRRLVDRGVTLLDAQLSQQILSDGGHYERSPMYHAIVLEALLTMDEALSHWEDVDRADLRAKIAAATAFLSAVAVQGNLPLLNDAAHGIAAPVNALLGAVSARKIASPIEEPEAATMLPYSGVFVFRSPKVAAVVDGGELGPPFLLAHAHCDTTSFELWLDGHPVLTDSGVYEYQVGPWRQYFRSATAHNVVTIEDRDPSEMWGSFRVARRQRPTEFTYDPTTSVVECGHDGYRRLGIMVRRRVRLPSEQSGVVVTELLDNSARPRPFSLHCHFAPGWSAESPRADRDCSIIYLTSEARSVTWFVLGCGFSVRDDPSWYAPEFGQKTLRPHLRVDGTCPRGRTRVTWGLLSGRISREEIDRTVASSHE